MINTATMTPLGIVVGPVWDQEATRSEFTDSAGNVAVTPDGKRAYVAISVTTVERAVGGQSSGSFITDAQVRNWMVTGEYRAVSVIDTDPTSATCNWP